MRAVGGESGVSLAGRRIYAQGGVGIVGRSHQDGPSDGLVVDGVAADVGRCLGSGVLGYNRLGIGLGRVLRCSVFRWGVFAGVLLAPDSAKAQAELKYQAEADEGEKRARILQGGQVPFF